MNVDKDFKQDSFWDFLRLQNFDNLVFAVLKCLFLNVDDDDDLFFLSNVIKLKYDLYRFVNIKWVFIVKISGSENFKEVKECKIFVSFMDIEWKERVIIIVRVVLSCRKFDEKKELLFFEDIEKMIMYFFKKFKEIFLILENFIRLVIIVQIRLFFYNKRRIGEFEVIK